MSTIFVPSIESRCSNYESNQSMGNEKDSDDNLDFIVTFLNLPESEAMKTQDEHENYTEKTSSPFVIYENGELTAETITTTATTTMEGQPQHEQFLQIQVLDNNNSNNNYDNYNNGDADQNDNNNNNNMQMQIVDEPTVTTSPSGAPSISPPTPTTITTLESSMNDTTTTPSLLPLPVLLSSTQNVVVDHVIESNGMQDGDGNTTKNAEQDQQKQKNIQKQNQTQNQNQNQNQIQNQNQNQNHKKEQDHEELDGVDEDDTDDEEDDDDDDDGENELTNLTWLTELRNQSITWPNSINPTILDDNLDSSAAGGENCNTFEAPEASSSSAGSRGMNGAQKQMTISSRTSRAKSSSLSHDAKMQASSSTAAKNGTAAGTAAQIKRPTPAERYQIFMEKVKSDLVEYEQSSINYQSDSTQKPPFNYSHIIGMAMLEKGRVTLQQICSWIEAKFAYFRVRKKWNNSIRHNLSLHHCFRKINRNKYEKGKGGYWELGLDPKKCDRKRIRNRKATNSTHKNKTDDNKMNTNNDRDLNLNNKNNSNNSTSNNNNNNSNSNSSFEIQEAATAAATLTEITAALPSIGTPSTGHHLEMEIDVGLPTTALVQAEQMLLDDLDVQQNIDISSNQQHQQQQHHHHNHHHQQQQHQPHHHHLHQSHHQQLISTDHQMQQEEAFIANVFANCIELDGVATTQEVVTDGVVCSSSNSNNELPLTLTTAACMPQYQLGTVIISTSADDLASLDGPLLSTLNSFICNNSNNSNIMSNNTSSNVFCSTQQQNKVLYREDEIPSASENIIVSSFLSDSLDPHSSSSFVSMPNQPNVIVEPLEPYYSVISASATTLVSTNTTGGGVGSGVGGGEGGFRPYIDGIDEAFQYLRSMDNNRSEDLLDNLLDISVSDY